MKHSELLAIVAARLDAATKKIPGGAIQPCPYLCIETTRVVAAAIDAGADRNEMLSLKEDIVAHVLRQIYPHNSVESWLNSVCPAAAAASDFAIDGPWDAMQGYHIALTRYRAAWARKLAKDWAEVGK